MTSILMVIMVMTSLPRKAYISRLIYQAYHTDKTKLKKHGAQDKIDFCTCSWCLEPPSTYQDPASLTKPPVFPSVIYLIGVSMMHIKIRYKCR